MVAAGAAAVVAAGTMLAFSCVRRSLSERREANRGILAKASEAVRVEPELLLAVAAVESGFDDRARSSKGAVGLLQVMPETARAVASRLRLDGWDLSDPRDNAVIGGAYLAELLRRYRGDEHLALAAYHAGPGRVDGWVEKGKGLPGPEVIEQFGLKSTRRYVDDVLALREAGRAERLPLKPPAE